AAAATAGELVAGELAQRVRARVGPRRRHGDERVAHLLAELDDDVGRARGERAAVHFLARQRARDDGRAVRELPVEQAVDRLAAHALRVDRGDRAQSLAPAQVQPDAGLRVHVLAEGGAPPPGDPAEARAALELRRRGARAAEERLRGGGRERAQREVAQAARELVGAAAALAHEEPRVDEAAPEGGDAPRRAAAAGGGDERARGPRTAGRAQRGGGPGEARGGRRRRAAA